MKITKLETFKVKPRWLFLKISTDEGVSGWGEPVVEGRADTTAAAIRELEGYLLGKDPHGIEDHFQTLYKGGFYRGDVVFMSAISGIEQALWDIKGKTYGVPVYEMLGGRCRDRIKVYSWIGGDDPIEVVEQAHRRLAQGFQAVKMNATGRMNRVGDYREVAAAAARLSGLRAGVGDALDIAVDFHGRVSRSMAKPLIKALEDYRPLFFEEPVLSEYSESYAALAATTSIPLATGERLYGRWGFKEVITGGAIDIIQPDISHAGGILECRKIAAMAEAYDISLAPHCPLGPIAAAACLHLDACTPNFIIQELSLQMHYHAEADLLDYVINKEMFTIADGHVALPTGPGLGVVIDEERVRAAAMESSDWKAPVWRYADGSVAEW